MTETVYTYGDVVWLTEFDNGAEVNPRQRCLIVCDGPENEMYTGVVDACAPDDDGLREFDATQIEGLADEQDWKPTKWQGGNDGDSTQDQAQGSTSAPTGNSDEQDSHS